MWGALALGCLHGTSPLRIEFPGALYHVISRGNERRAIVRDDLDRERRLDWLRRTVEMFEWRLHAFVLLDSHDHLFVETPEANLSAGMHHYNGSYTGYFNRRHRRAGHLFQGRFKGHLVEEQGYFLEVSRYIHLNPVRARRVARPEAWRWGSCAGYLRKAWELPWVTYGRVLGEFAKEASLARRRYGRFLRAGVEDPPSSPFEDAKGGLLLGSTECVDRVRRMLGERREDPDVPQLRQTFGRVLRWRRSRWRWQSDSASTQATGLRAVEATMPGGRWRRILLGVVSAIRPRPWQSPWDIATTAASGKRSVASSTGPPHCNAQ